MHTRSGQLLLPPHVAARYRQQQAAREIERRIAHEVKQVYPGHLFQITVDAEQGYVYIDHPLLASNKGRYFVSKSDGMRKVLHMCGEILERVNIRRGEIEDVRAYDEAQGLAKEAFRVH